MTTILANAGYSHELYTNKLLYLELVESGVQGALVKATIMLFPEQTDAICKALSVSKKDISRIGNKTLSTHQSETILDIISVLDMTYLLFENDMPSVQEWISSEIRALNSKKPMDFLNTFMGRSILKETLNKMKYGEFS